MFYLNTANPALCTGTITSWRVCYYEPTSDDIFDRFWATYAVYRRTNITHYERVSQIFSAVRSISQTSNRLEPIVDGLVDDEDINCYDDGVGNSPLSVQAGDVIGACIFDPENRNIRGLPLLFVNRLPLNIVGRDSGEEDFLLQMGTSGCSREILPTEVYTNQLLNVSSLRLHIYTNIGKF